MRRSRATTRFAFTSRSARNARCFGPPSGTGPFPPRTSSEPSTRYSICPPGGAFTALQPFFYRTSRAFGNRSHRAAVHLEEGSYAQEGSACADRRGTVGRRDRRDIGRSRGDDQDAAARSRPSGDVAGDDRPAGATAGGALAAGLLARRRLGRDVGPGSQGTV